MPTASDSKSAFFRPDARKTCARTEMTVYCFACIKKLMQAGGETPLARLPRVAAAPTQRKAESEPAPAPAPAPASTSSPTHRRSLPADRIVKEWHI